MERYEHKVVLITGAGDIAGATARRLLSEGGKVALTDFSREALDQEARMLKEEGYPAGQIYPPPSARPFFKGLLRWHVKAQRPSATHFPMGKSTN